MKFVLICTLLITGKIKGILSEKDFKHEKQRSIYSPNIRKSSNQTNTSVLPRYINGYPNSLPYREFSEESISLANTLLRKSQNTMPLLFSSNNAIGININNQLRKQRRKKKKKDKHKNKNRQKLQKNTKKINNQTVIVGLVTGFTNNRSSSKNKTVTTNVGDVRHRKKVKKSKDKSLKRNGNYRKGRQHNKIGKENKKKHNSFMNASNENSSSIENKGTLKSSNYENNQIENFITQQLQIINEIPSQKSTNTYPIEYINTASETIRTTNVDNDLDFTTHSPMNYTDNSKELINNVSEHNMVYFISNIPTHKNTLPVSFETTSYKPRTEDLQKESTVTNLGNKSNPKIITERKYPSNDKKYNTFSAMDIMSEINKVIKINNETNADIINSTGYGPGDLSCLLDKFVPAPNVENAAVKYLRSNDSWSKSGVKYLGHFNEYAKKHMASKNTTQFSPEFKLHSYLEVEYHCESGYHMEHNKSGKLICSERQWTGEVPRCISKGNNILKNYTSMCTGEESNCEQLCFKVNGKAICSCYHGFHSNESTCVDNNECDSNNGGCDYSCINTIGSFICICPEGLRLSLDGKSCLDINECLLRNGHGPCQDSCTNYHGGYICNCSGIPGTRLASDNHTCEDVDECARGTSGCSHICLNTLGRAFCSCPSGYQLGDDWKTCNDIDECQEDEFQINNCESGCINTVGSYYCQQQNHECDDDSCDNCVSQKCNNNEKKVTLKSGNDLLLCPPGFTSGLLGECIDINECSENNGGCSHECHNTFGSVVCLCPSYLTIDSDWKTCIDLKTKTPVIPVVCTNGYVINKTGHCEDLNECLEDNGGCSQLCTNTDGSFHCSCLHGFVLDMDGVSCIDVATAAVCPPLDVPPNGYLHCKRHVIMTNSYGLFHHLRRRVVNHAGTICVLKCPYGGKVKGIYQKICTQSGHWVGPEHGSCKYFRSPQLKCPDNITVTVPQGKKTAYVTIPQPSTSVNWYRNVISEPPWGKMLEANLPSGHWKLKFTARHPISHLSTSCTLHVIVKN